MSPTVVWTIVVAAGSGQRFGGEKLQAIITPPSGTVLDRSILVATDASDGVVVVCPPDRVGSVLLPPAVREVAGGATRSDSVRRGLAAVPDDATIVLVHDAARPLADHGVYERVISAVAAGAQGAVPVVGLVDTIRSLDGGVVDRDLLRAVQTPQGFDAASLRRAHAQGGQATDDAGLVEAMGGTIVLVEGDSRNVKITRPVDLVVVRALIDES